VNQNSEQQDCEQKQEQPNHHIIIAAVPHHLLLVLEELASSLQGSVEDWLYWTLHRQKQAGKARSAVKQTFSLQTKLGTKLPIHTVPCRRPPPGLERRRRLLHCHLDDPRPESRQPVHDAPGHAAAGERVGEVDGPRRPEARQEDDHVADAPQPSPGRPGVLLARRPAPHACPVACLLVICKHDEFTTTSGTQQKKNTIRRRRRKKFTAEPEDFGILFR